jgi:hypothetical protein
MKSDGLMLRIINILYSLKNAYNKGEVINIESRPYHMANDDPCPHQLSPRFLDIRVSTID